MTDRRPHRTRRGLVRAVSPRYNIKGRSISRVLDVLPSIGDHQGRRKEYFKGEGGCFKWDSKRLFLHLSLPQNCIWGMYKICSHFLFVVHTCYLTGYNHHKKVRTDHDKDPPFMK